MVGCVLKASTAGAQSLTEFRAHIADTALIGLFNEPEVLPFWDVWLWGMDMSGFAW